MKHSKALPALTSLAFLAGLISLASCAATATVASPPADPASPAPLEPRARESAPAPRAAQEDAAALEPRIHKVALLLGKRGLDSGVWAPVEDHTMFGVEYANEKPGSAVGWEVGGAFSSDSANFLGLDVKGKTTEFYGGVRKTFLEPEGEMHPYVAGGLSLINGDFEVAGVSDDDSSLAVYLHGGFLYDFTRGFYGGIDLRFLFGSDITIAGAGGDADYVQFALTLGWAF